MTFHTLNFARTARLLPESQKVKKKLGIANAKASTEHATSTSPSKMRGNTLHGKAASLALSRREQHQGLKRATKGRKTRTESLRPACEIWPTGVVKAHRPSHQVPNVSQSEETIPALEEIDPATKLGNEDLTEQPLSGDMPASLEGVLERNAQRAAAPPGSMRHDECFPSRLADSTAPDNKATRKSAPSDEKARKRHQTDGIASGIIGSQGDHEGSDGDCNCYECKSFDLLLDTLPPRGDDVKDQSEIKIASPKPKPPLSVGLVDRLEQMSLVDEHTDTDSPTVPGDDIVDQSSSPIEYNNDFVATLSWRQMDLAAEEEDNSFFGRARQLAIMGDLNDEDAEALLSTGIGLATVWLNTAGKHMRDCKCLPASSMPRNDPEWKWADLNLDAEDREDSIFGRVKQMAEMGLGDDLARQDFYALGIKLAKRWLTASSTPDSSIPVKQESAFNWQLDPLMMTRGWGLTHC